MIISRHASIDATPSPVVAPVPRRMSNTPTDIGVAFQQHVQQQAPSKPNVNYNMKIIEAMNERNKLALKKMEENENKQKLAAAAVAAANNKILNNSQNTPPLTLTTTQNTPTTGTTTTTSTFNKLSPGNIFKNFFK